MADSITRSNIGNKTWLAPATPLIDDACKALETTVAECIAAKQIQLILDLEQVSLIGSRAMEIMLETNAKLAQSGGSLRFVHASTLVRDILIATGLAEQFAQNLSELGSAHHAGEEFAELPPMKIGEILLDMGLTTEDNILAAASKQSTSSKRIGKILMESGTITGHHLLAALSRQLNIPHLKLRTGMYEKPVTELISREAAKRLEIVPMFKVHNTLTLATADPQSITALDEIQEITGCKLRLMLAEREDILKHQIDAYSSNDFMPEMVDNMATDIELVEQEQADQTHIDEMAGGSPVIKLVNGLIQRAVRDGASDIHIESGCNRSLVRFRIDGILYEVLSTRADLHPAIVSRLKVMANLDIAERRLPQDGRMQVMTQGRNIDLRFSSLPGIYGEKVVLRVLDKNQSILDVEKLGMSVPNLNLLKQLLGRSYGLILVTGPTGSGKTTTLYAAINQLKSIEKNIVTIEDPVEYQLDIINQNQVNESIGLSFSRVLRHVLRQDPDIIMVGEIRDKDTAEIAVQSALTGHLVLSTLHTNNAVGALSRMMEMGVEPYLLSSALAGVVGQRLVRGVCPSCKTTYLPPPELVEKYHWPEGTRLTRGRGCSECYDSGYRGRLGIHEIIEASDGLQRLMAKNPTKDELQAYTREEGYKTLFDDGMLRVLDGRTTIEEVSRVIHAV